MNIGIQKVNILSLIVVLLFSFGGLCAAQASTGSNSGATSSVAPNNPPGPGGSNLRLKGCPVIAKEYIHTNGSWWEYRFFDPHNSIEVVPNAAILPQEHMDYYFCPQPGPDLVKVRLIQHCQNFDVKHSFKPGDYTGASWSYDIEDSHHITLQGHKMNDNGHAHQCSVREPLRYGPGWMRMDANPKWRIAVTHFLALKVNPNKYWLSDWQHFNPRPRGDKRIQ